jgi:hypothetical protein
LAFKFGYLPGSPEERLHKDWLRDRHHAPSDDLNQPVDQAVRVADAAGPSAVEAG